MSTQIDAVASIALPSLSDGELNGGLQFENGKPHHWVILLPGDAEGADHDTQLTWAAEGGGDLPTPSEQSLLRANLPDEFKAEWYWSNKKHGRGWAWSTGFSYGIQTFSSVSTKLRARRVRRSPI